MSFDIDCKADSHERHRRNWAKLCTGLASSTFVSVDNSTIEFSAGALQVKDNGITIAKLNVLSAKGQLISHNNTTEVIHAATGTNRLFLLSDSTQTSGLRWGSALSAKGDLFTHDGTGDAGLPVGATNGHVLKVNSAATNGIEWGAVSVTGTGLTSVTTDRLIGRDTAGTGASEELQVQNGLEFTGGPGIGIANDGVTFARMQNIATGGILCRYNSGTGDIERIGVDTDGHVLDVLNQTFRVKYYSLDQSNTDVGSVGTGETTLHTQAVQNSRLTADLDQVIYEAGLTVVNSASTKQVQLKLNSPTTGLTTLIDTGAMTPTATGSVLFKVRLTRKGSTTLLYGAECLTSGLATNPIASVGQVTGTSYGQHTLSITGTAAGGAAANNDIVLKYTTYRVQRVS